MVEMPAPANSPSERSGTRSPSRAPPRRVDVDAQLAREPVRARAARAGADSETTLRSVSRRSFTPRSSRRNVSAAACEESSEYW